MPNLEVFENIRKTRALHAAALQNLPIEVNSWPQKEGQRDDAYQDSDGHRYDPEMAAVFLLTSLAALHVLVVEAGRIHRGAPYVGLRIENPATFVTVTSVLKLAQ
jgi:hypothetical protein